MEERLEWCIQTEKYEMAARLRDLIKYETTDHEEFKEQYFYQLLEKYGGHDLLDSIKSKKREQIR